MSGRNLALSVIVRLKETISGPLGKLQSRLKSIGNLGRKIGALGGVLAGISFAAPIHQAAAFDSQLRDIAITAGLTGKEVEKYIAKQSRAFEELALKTGQTSRDVAAGAQLLIAAGMEEKLINDLMPAIARTSTAAGAAMEDTAKTAFALSNTLKVPAADMETAMGKLVTAGKLGRFEFANMAKSFPELASQVQKLGLTGQEAVSTLGASLQIAMYGTDSPDTAANNFKNFLAKITSPDTVKRFKKAGIDLPKVMADATAKGINPVEAMFQKIQQATKVSKKDIDAIYARAKKEGKSDKEAEAEVKSRMEKVLASTELGKLFSDIQVMDFLIPLLANIDKYKEFKQEIGGSDSTVIGEDFNSRMNGIEKQWQRFGEIGEQMSRRVGRAFATNLEWMNKGLEKLLQGLSWLDTTFPGLVDTILSFGGILLLAAGSLGILTTILPVVSAGLSVLAGIVGLILSPLGLLIGLLAGAVYIIYENWDTFAPYFKGLWNGLKNIFKGGVSIISGLLSGDFSRVFSGMKQLGSGLVQSFQSSWSILSTVFMKGIGTIDRLLGTNLTGKIQNVAAKLEPAWNAITTAVSRGMEAVGSALMGDFGPARQLFDDFITFVLDWGNKLKDDMRAAIVAAKDGVVKAFSDLWDAAKQTFYDFLSSITEGLTSLPGKISGMFTWNEAPAEATASQGTEQKQGLGPLSRRGFGASYASRFASSTEVSGRIVVSAAEGSKIVNTESSNPAVPLAPDRGTTLGRP